MPIKSSASLNHLLHKYPHREEVEEFVQGVASLQPLLVLLFGSLATGEFTQNSDADILVLFEEQQDWSKVYKFSTGIVQPIVKSRREMLNGIREGSTFLIEMVEDGIPLLDAGQVYAEMERAVTESKESLGIVRERDGWKFTVRGGY